MTSIALPLHFAPTQASSSQNSILDDKLEIKYAQPYEIFLTSLIMATLLVEFSMKGYKIRIFFAKNQHNQRKLLNCENWSIGELSKIGHHFRK